MRAFSRWTRRALLIGGAVLVMAGSCDEGDPADPDDDDEEISAIVATVLEGGVGVPGVTVRLFADGGASALRTVNATSGAGVARFDTLTPGAYEVEVTVPAGMEMVPGQLARKDVTVTEGGTATVSFSIRDVVIPPTTGEIRARVADGASAIVGVTVSLFDAGGVVALDTELTDATGFALFQTLDAGDYDVAITLPANHTIGAGDTARKEVSVTAGSRTEVAFEVDAPPTVDIFVGGTSFSDNDVTIAPGTTVRWIWSNGSHTVTPTGHAEWTSTALDSSGDMLVHVFNGVGTFNYHCIPHQGLGMTGVIRVQN